MCIDIVGIWFGFANGQILSIFDIIICLANDSVGVLLSHIYLLLPFLGDSRW